MPKGLDPAQPRPQGPLLLGPRGESLFHHGGGVGEDPGNEVGSRSGLPAVSREEMTKPLLTKFVRSRLLDVDLQNTILSPRLKESRSLMKSLTLSL